MTAFRSSFYEKEYEEVSKALERVGGGPPPSNKDSSVLNDNEATVIATTSNENQEKHKTAAVKELEDKVRWLESQVSGLEASNGQKQAMIAELKAQWSGALTNWTKNQQELVDQVQQARRQVDTLQLENASAKEVHCLISTQLKNRAYSMKMAVINIDFLIKRHIFDVLNL